MNTEQKTETNHTEIEPKETGRKDIMEMPVPLSGRLEAIVEMAGRGETVCDVGCDHAHVPIRLLQSKCFDRAIGMDVIAGPLGKAAGNLSLYGMEDRVELRLSDGLDACRPGEADTLVVTGMGGTLMREILLREPEKTGSFQALVLGPQSDPDKVRSALRSLGFLIDKEKLVYEDGKYYPILHAVPADRAHRAMRPGKAGEKKAPDPGEHGPGQDSPDTASQEEPQDGLFREADLLQEAEDLFGPVLLHSRDPVLYEYLTRQEAVLTKILLSVRNAAEELQKNLQEVPGSTGNGSSCQKRLLLARHLTRQQEIGHSLCVFRAALRIYEGKG